MTFEILTRSPALHKLMAFFVCPFRDEKWNYCSGMVFSEANLNCVSELLASIWLTSEK